MDYASISSIRPDRPLTVECKFVSKSKSIRFTSARNCAIHLLKNRIEQCFSLAPGSFTISYKDDDGETLEINTEGDLTDAVYYFQSGVDDPPISSAASFYSSRSVGSRKILVRVLIQVDYDGPSLSDTASLVGTDEDIDLLDEGDLRDVISLADSSNADLEPEDDAITISSKDTGGDQGRRLNGRGPSLRRDFTSAETLIEHPGEYHNVLKPEGLSSQSSGLSKGQAKTIIARPSRTFGRPPGARARSPLANDLTNEVSEDSDSRSSSEFSAAGRYPVDPSAVFERLKYLEQTSSSTLSEPQPSGSLERGRQWLLEQSHSSRSPLAPLLGPESEVASSSAGDGEYDQLSQSFEGDLALERDPRGRYYYTYTGGSSAASQNQDEDYQARDQMKLPDSKRESRDSRIRDSMSVAPSITQPLRTLSDPSPIQYADLPEEVLPFIETAVAPHHIVTDCSSCGEILDSIRYICAACGEKRPCHELLEANGKGKGKQAHTHIYPPLSGMANGHGAPLGSPESSSSSSSRSSNRPLPVVPNPLVPSKSWPAQAARRGSDSDSSISKGEGYELCSNCMQGMGIMHAIEGMVMPSDPTSQSPHRDSVMAAMRRSAPKRKGMMRHAYVEKIWSGNQWQDVEQDLSSKCSICSSSLTSDIYRCFDCNKFELCKACYSQVHEIHPSHAFLVARDMSTPDSSTPPSPQRAHSEPDVPLNEIDFMIHPGVKCSHCMLDIVGARFHCAICESVDICANCESVGLPGNLTSDDGGHDSSHIMIKIPFPLEREKVQSASGRAVHLWDRDAPKVTNGATTNSGRGRSNSGGSDHAKTVIGGRLVNQNRLSHGVACRACGKNILGVRYQCATCPSLPTSYSLCADCEPLSYVHHNPMHLFLKIVRPVNRPIESALGLLPTVYRTPAGTKPDGSRNLDDPQEYIKSLYHHTSLCDVCMERIRGEWYRCVYCAKDLCSHHEAMDSHNPNHLFIVFKSMVDMAQYRNFTDLENPSNSPPLIPYQVYFN